LPEEAKGWNKKRKQESSQTQSQTNPIIVFLPVIVANPLTVLRTERPILPKEPAESQSHPTQETPTTSQYQANITRVNQKRQTGTQTETQTGTQTERRKKSSSAQCSSIRHFRKRTRTNDLKTKGTAQTQTIESILSKKGHSSVKTVSTNVGSTLFSTSISTAVDATLSDACSTQVNDMSIQTEEHVLSSESSYLAMDTTYSTIETQTSATCLPGFSLEDQELFSLFDTNDIETQTQWNNDCTTQTAPLSMDMSELMSFDLFAE